MSQYLHHHLKLHHLHFTEINELYISLSLQAFSMGLIGIFVPLYLYVLNYSLASIALYFIVFSTIKMLAFPLSTYLVMQLGPKHIMMLSYAYMFLYIVLLYVLPQYPNGFFPAAIIAGICSGLFWMARHIDMASIMSQKTPTTEISNLLIAITVAQAFAPLIGGVIATTYGIEYTLLGTAIGLLLAMYPLRKTLEPVIPQEYHLKLFKTAPLRHLIANSAMNAQSNVSTYIWPLYIFLVVSTYQNVGLIASASLVLVVILLHILGKLGDRGKNHQMLKIGSRLRSVVHAGRTLTQSFAAVLGVNILGDITDTITSVPYAVHFYGNAKKYGAPNYLTDLEIIGSVGTIIIWGVLFIAASLTDQKTALIITFILAALLMPLLRLIEPASPSKSNQI